MARDFRKIRAWEKADELAILVYEMTQRSFPREEQYGLTSQLRRAAVSVAANIAEGSAKQHNKEFLQYLYSASASLAEVEYYIHLAGRLSYLDSGQRNALDSVRLETGQVLQGLIRTIQGQIRKGRTHN